MLPSFEFHEIARLSAMRIVDSLVEGTAIGAFAALVLGLRRHSASIRFTLWFSALMAVAAVPVVRGLLSPYRNANSVAHPALTLPDSWAVYVFVTWAAIAMWQLLALTRAVWHLRQLRSTCAPLEAGDHPELFATLRHAAAARCVSLCCSDEVRVPTVIGLWKSAIVFPRWVLTELSTDELRQILLHEVAHLRRRDDWSNLLQQLVKAIFFFHPAVWWIEKRVSLEREMACDDAVLEATASPRAYAECLAHLAEKSFARRSVALAQAALGKMRQTSLRVAQILDPTRVPNPPEASSTKTYRWQRPAALVAGFAVFCVVCASREPNLIAFQASETSMVARASTGANVLTPTKSEALLKSSALVAADSTPLVPITPASMKLSTAPHRSALLHRRATTPRAAKPFVHSVVPYRLTSFRSDINWLPFSEAVFFIIQTEEVQNGERNSSPQPAVQIQMWHLLVLHPVIDPDGGKLPPKQT